MKYNTISILFIFIVVAIATTLFQVNGSATSKYIRFGDTNIEVTLQSVNNNLSASMLPGVWDAFLYKNKNDVISECNKGANGHDEMHNQRIPNLSVMTKDQSCERNETQCRIMEHLVEGRVQLISRMENATCLLTAIFNVTVRLPPKYSTGIWTATSTTAPRRSVDWTPSHKYTLPPSNTSKSVDCTPHGWSGWTILIITIVCPLATLFVVCLCLLTALRYRPLATVETLIKAASRFLPLDTVETLTEVASARLLTRKRAMYTPDPDQEDPGLMGDVNEDCQDEAAVRIDMDEGPGGEGQDDVPVETASRAIDETSTDILIAGNGVNLLQ